MTLYAAGDLQGCIDPLHRLLDRVHFDPAKDCLWLTGDIVNRGPQSLAALRFVKSLGQSAVTVLGNHDLHLLAVAHTDRKAKKKDTLNDILSAPDAADLLEWLRQQPLMHFDSSINTALVHAGIPHVWTLEQSLRYAKEVETILRSDHYPEYLETMYGNTPDVWSDALSGMTRYRLITNYLTRMRFIAPTGELELITKTDVDDAPPGYAPWFSYPLKIPVGTKILFGHWAALCGRSSNPACIALDAGYVWGNEMKLLRLQDEMVWLEPGAQH